MNDTFQLATAILRSTGLYSDDALARIENGRADNPGMGLAEAAVKFGGAREQDFLKKAGEFLGMDYIELENVQPRPDILQKLPASAVYQYNVLPIKFDGGVLTVVSSDPFSTVAGDGLRPPQAAPSRSPSPRARRSTRP